MGRHHLTLVRDGEIEVCGKDEYGVYDSLEVALCAQSPYDVYSHPQKDLYKELYIYLYI